MTRVLHETAGGEAHDAGADHLDRALTAGKPELRRQLRRAPGKGDAGAAMAVIVDEALIAERLGANDESGRAIGAETRHGADHATGRDLDGRQASGRQRRSRPGHRRRATGNGDAAERERGETDEATAIGQHRPTLARAPRGATHAAFSIVSTVRFSLV